MQKISSENLQIVQKESPKQEQQRIRLNPIEQLLILMMLDSEAFKIVRDNSLKGICVEMLLRLISDDYDGALVIADQILEKKKIYRVYIFKHSILTRQKKLDEAMFALQKAYEIKPISRKINFLIGMQLKKQQKYQEALQYFESSISKKPNCNISFQIGLLYQEIQEHNQAILNFTTACDIRPKNKFYIAKSIQQNIDKLVNSFKALKQYDEALECCQIAILAKPQKSIYYIYKKDLLFLMGKTEESEQLGEQICKIDAFYTLEHFKEKRRLEIERVLLQKRQSQLRRKPTSSQIISKQLQQSLIQHLDAFYFAFTFFFVSTTQKGIHDISQQIGEQLSTKEKIHLGEFDKLVLHCLRTIFPDIEKMEDNKIECNLLDWSNLKMNKQENCSIFLYLFQLLSIIVKEEIIRDLITERLQEDFMKKFEREKKQQEFIILIGCVCKEFKNIECSIFDSTAGQLGLEHALLLLGYMIIHSQLAQDEEDISALIWRLFAQKDLNQLFVSQSFMKKQQKTKQFIDQQVSEIQKSEIDDAKNTVIKKFFDNLSKKK